MTVAQGSEVYLRDRYTMPEGNSHAWINALSVEELRNALTLRNLNADGILPTLRARLLKFEMEVSGEACG